MVTQIQAAVGHTTSAAICEQAITVHELLARRLDRPAPGASPTTGWSTSRGPLQVRAQAEPWIVPSFVAAQADRVLRSAATSEAPIAAASWFERLPDAILDLLERRDPRTPRTLGPAGEPDRHRRATDR